MSYGMPSLEYLLASFVGGAIGALAIDAIKNNNKKSRRDDEGFGGDRRRFDRLSVAGVFSSIDAPVALLGATSNILSLGAVNASEVDIAKAGIVTKVLGSLNVAQTASFPSTANQLVLGGAANVTINAPAPLASRVYSTYDAGINCNFNLGVPNQISLTASGAQTTLLPSQSGSLIFVPLLTAAATMTLPVQSVPGLKYTFQVLTTQTTAAITFTTASGNVSGAYVIGSAALLKAPATSFTITNIATQGTSVTIVGDGTNWSIFGSSSVVGFT